jgi:26S proteasome non-ATPase regulatory subunit 9
MQFGSLVHRNWSAAALQSVTANSENQPLSVVVRRNPEGIVQLRLVPCRWDGRGLLGCGIQPIESVAEEAVAVASQSAGAPRP